MTDTAIQLQGVTKRYGELQVLKGIDLSVPAGRFVAVIGKSGSGKSTLLAVMSGLEKADGGDVLLAGENLSGHSEARMAELRRRTIGFVFQSFNLIPSLSALDNVLLPTFFDGDAAASRARAVSLLEQVGLGGRLHHRPSQLSGGEQQRVAIARALVGHPKILLADEPTGNLDAETGADVLGLLLDMTRINGATLLIVTHDLDIAARADMKIEMKDGRILNGHA
ncbi:ABC transporter ATP-binding protein [Xanthobacteraceae bacterium Astr-EGSB]|uniref:ABC transporter ATP-binding protein n=1 Tax=Astrobacterium formosum TaxID=3069710 RepID=UPI0027B6936F|nr:ABC transporter ATP-binding protein [Xanthobacteraceae bacterium Astr-EGSB]